MGYPKQIHRPTTIEGSWHNMISRCNRPNSTEYLRYGARGIRVCARWLRYDNFYDDMIATYSKGLSIDRIDNDGDYELSNCRWSTAKNQALNRRTNVRLTFNSRTQTLQEWSDELKIKRSTIEARLARGLGITESLTVGRITS